MSKQDINNFSFWCPVDISKAIDETTGEEIMLLGGIASTADEDSDGEFLDPKGFDIKPLIESGLVNWHHQAKTCPATIVGEPTKAEIRKDGLYIETKLYPSSQVARDIWELAQTLDRDSKTRRLGYSIEGKVLERKSNDPKSPDYKKISKAIITGVAITHQPKNPKTFANIIKGEIDDDFDEDNETEEKEEEKSLDTTAAKPLIKEELDPKIKVTTFGKSEVMDKLFQDIPGISIEKAKKIFILIQNISKMAKHKAITQDDISKAYDALGFSVPEDIVKGDDSEVDENSEEDIDDTEEDTEEDVKKAKTRKNPVVEETEEEEEEEEEESDEDDTEDDDEEDEEDVAEKAQMFDEFERIEKALVNSHLHNTRYIKALGVLVKEQSQNLTKAINALNIANDKIDELSDINKAQMDEISSLREQLDVAMSHTPSPKSVRSVAAVERNFNKAQDDEMGGERDNQISIRNKSAVLDILDQATFAKGYDSEFSKACTDFEASGNLSMQIVKRLKNEFNVEII